MPSKNKNVTIAIAGVVALVAIFAIATRYSGQQTAGSMLNGSMMSAPSPDVPECKAGARCNPPGTQGMSCSNPGDNIVFTCCEGTMQQRDNCDVPASSGSPLPIRLQ